ncbi:MAG: FxsA family protein [Actinomycetota bacterium]|nr:FxsA family protein [Actinomycetota bacterium]
MLGLLVVLFVIVPIAELFVIIQVGQVIGAWNTIGLLLLVSFAGAWLVKREGLGVIRRFRQQLDRGAIPGRELADGVLIILAGALMLTPGFLTDVVGLLLLIPPTRAAVRRTVLRRLSNKVYWRRVS